MGEILSFSPAQEEPDKISRPSPDPDNPVTVDVDLSDVGIYPREFAKDMLRSSFDRKDPELEGEAMNMLTTYYGQEKAQQIRDAERIRFDLIHPKPHSLKLVK